jgi:hypothetical protein
MTPVSKTITLAAIAGTLVLAYAIGRQGSDADLERRLARLEADHRALQDAFITGSRERRAALAQRFGYQPVARPGPSAGGATSRLPSPEVQRRAARQSYERLQQQFAGEPIDAAWAGTVRQNVEDVLVGLAAQGPEPRSVQVDCRSRTCRISLDLADTGEVDALVQPLLTEISGDLSETEMLQLPSPDGERLELHIFARRGTPPKASPLG